MNTRLWFGASLLVPGLVQASCRYDTQVPLEDLRWAFCLEGRIESYAQSTFLEAGDLQQGRLFGGSYTSLAARSWLSLHAQASGNATFTTMEAEETGAFEHMFLQVGHPLLHDIHGAIGRVPLPFGLDLDPFRLAVSRRSAGFWDRNVSGARFSVLMRDALRLELGSALRDGTDSSSFGEADTFAVRLTQLTDLLSGTKLIASYQARSQGSEEHKWGVSALVYSGQDRTSLEWARISQNNADNFEQVFRFGHSHSSAPWTFDFVYEDVRKDSSIWSFGGRYALTQGLEISAQTHYKRTRASAIPQELILLLGFGMEAGYVQQGSRADVLD